MTDLVREAADRYGLLRSVVGAHAFHASAGRDDRYDEYVFEFDCGSLTVTAEPSDDSIRLGGEGATLLHLTDLSNEEPWARLIGCGVLWIWRLTNQNGFVDGLQLELGQPGECWSVQLMCEGSALSARSLGSLDRMSNLIG